RRTSTRSARPGAPPDMPIAPMSSHDRWSPGRTSSMRPRTRPQDGRRCSPTRGRSRRSAWPLAATASIRPMRRSSRRRGRSSKNEYTICKPWGTTGYAYRTDVITRPMESWQDFIDAAQDEAAGRTSLLSDAWEVAAIGLAARGYSLNTTDEKELEEARTIIVDEVAPNVRAYFGSASTGMIQGSFDLMQSYNGDARQAFGEVDNPEDWEFVFPTPSANLWMDCWAIATGAPHPDAAHAFINFM